MANLELNVPKTICMLLLMESLDQVAVQLAAACFPWSNLSMAHTGKYLGFWVGPEKERRFWKDAGHKMLQRAEAWAWRELVLYYSTVVYNSFIASISMFVAQLEPYPEEFEAVEEALLRRAATGSFNWALRHDLHHLQEL